jgi:hypothetical protein
MLIAMVLYSRMFTVHTTVLVCNYSMYIHALNILSISHELSSYTSTMVFLWSSIQAEGANIKKLEGFTSYRLATYSPDINIHIYTVSLYIHIRI